MTNELAISEATYAELQKSLDSERLIDLTITIGFYNAVVRILHTLKIDVEEAYRGCLQEFPLPADRGNS